jgi:hypothetical protein
LHKAGFYGKSKAMEKQAKLEYDKAWKAAHPEKQVQYRREWRGRNPEKRHEEYIKNKEKVLEQNKAWRASLTEEQKDTMQWRAKLRRYGITLEDYNAMFAEQGGKCAICGAHQSELPAPLFVDHNHETGQVRKLLCRNCNLVLGFARDNIEILKVAISYLKDHVGRRV